MKGIEAWEVINESLHQLYRLRYNFTRGETSFTEEEAEAEKICFKALQEYDKRRTNAKN